MESRGWGFCKRKLVLWYAGYRKWTAGEIYVRFFLKSRGECMDNQECETEFRWMLNDCLICLFERKELTEKNLARNVRWVLMINCWPDGEMFRLQLQLYWVTTYLMESILAGTLMLKNVLKNLGKHFNFLVEILPKRM